MAAKSYHGKVLHVNLTDLTYSVETPPESFYRKYGGGSAMGVFYILHEMEPGVDPLSEKNILTVFTSVVTGLPISGQSRMTVNAKSPLTNAIGDSQAGGFFPVKLKATGYDGIVIRGRAANPIYLWINDGKVEFRDAGHLWGKITGEVEETIKQELGDRKVEIMQIGPAGEKLVRFASIMNMSNRANGRTGMGAVMGSKNLKAIVVQGSHRVSAADSKKISKMYKVGTASIPENPVLNSYHLHGTAGDVSAMQAVGGFPTRNFNMGQFDGYESISGERVTETILKDRDTCFSCSVRCKRVIETEYLGEKVLPFYGGPEYESTATLGSYCCVSDVDAVALANQLCNQYGMDTISCGATVAFAMECMEAGLISREETGGVDLQFSNAEALVKTVELIGKREGIGDLLAEGSQRAAIKIGKTADEYLVTARGQEIPAHMPQSKRAMGLIYAVNPFGADHESSEHDPSYEQDLADPQSIARMAELGLTELQPYGSLNSEKARMVAVTQKVFSALDSYNLCSFVWGIGFQLYGPNDTVEMINAATGWEMDLDEFLTVGERRINMMREFNAREGFTRQEDNLSKKFFKPLLGDGPCAGIMMTRDEFELVKDSYYGHMGWDAATGNPTPEGLNRLGLDWLTVESYR